jgi:uncharacterized hydrophobic protein (TIGR00271 family)
VSADVAREGANPVVAALRALDLHHHGSITLSEVTAILSDDAARAQRAAPGIPDDGVVWDLVESRVRADSALSWVFLAFLTLATLIAGVGRLTDQPILIIGAMVVGPEFGPLAGLCVAAVHKRPELARRSLAALAVGFPVGMTLAWLMTVILRATGSAPDTIEARTLTQFISNPDEFTVIVAVLAGTAGILSLTSAKSGALIGVLISVTTIPAAGNAAVAVAYGDWHEWLGAVEQLALNLVVIFLAGVATLFIQRRLYISRRKRHLGAHYREAAGLPLDHRRKSSVVLPSSRERG